MIYYVFSLLEKVLSRDGFLLVNEFEISVDSNQFVHTGCVCVCVYLFKSLIILYDLDLTISISHQKLIQGNCPVVFVSTRGFEISGTRISFDCRSIENS